MVQSSWSIAWAVALHQCCWYLGCRLHFYRVFYEKTLLSRQWIWNRTDFSDFFYSRHSYSSDVAWNIKTSWLQGIFSKMETPKYERLAVSNIVERNRVAWENDRVEPWGKDKCSRGSMPWLPSQRWDMIWYFKYSK